MTYYINETLGQRIKRIVKASDRRLNDLVAVIGRPQSYVSLLVNDRVQYPKEEIVRKIALALGDNPDEMLLAARIIPSDIREALFRYPSLISKIRAE